MIFWKNFLKRHIGIIIILLAAVIFSIFVLPSPEDDRKAFEEFQRVFDDKISEITVYSYSNGGDEKDNYKLIISDELVINELCKVMPTNLGRKVFSAAYTNIYFIKIKSAKKDYWVMYLMEFQRIKSIEHYDGYEGDERLNKEHGQISLIIFQPLSEAEIIENSYPSRYAWHSFYNIDLIPIFKKFNELPFDGKHKIKFKYN